MNANARRFPSDRLRLGALYLAIALALTLPAATSAQETPKAPTPAAQTDPADTTVATEAAETESKKSGPLFSIEDSDDPELLKELTQFHNTFEFGFNYVSDDSFRFGRYSGLTDQGVNAVLNLDVLDREAYDSDNADYWHFRARNFGLDSREATFEFGTQGSYKIHIDYDQIPIFRSDSAKTIFDGAGTSNLTLPANWVGSGNTAGMTNLLPDLKSVDLKTERRRTALGVSGVLSPHWNYSANYTHETKDGHKSIGAVFGNSGGNPRSVLVPEPVDYLTQQFEATLRYTTKKLQLQAAYYLSVFSDDNTALRWSNPYTAIGGWDPSAGFPNGRGQLSLPPDNRFHQITLDGGYNFSDRTRFSASVSRGRMSQNDAFLPYTDIPTLAASITQPLPRDSLDGRIDTTVVNLRIASRPSDKFSWNAAYRTTIATTTRRATNTSTSAATRRHRTPA